MRLSGDVDGALGIAVLKGIVEGNDVGLAGGKYLRQSVHKIVIGRVVGPESEDAAGVEFGGELAEAIGGVEGGVAFVEEIFGGVVDVEEDGVIEAAG